MPPAFTSPDPLLLATARALPPVGEVTSGPDLLGWLREDADLWQYARNTGGLGPHRYTARGYRREVAVRRLGGGR